MSLQEVEQYIHRLFPDKEAREKISQETKERTAKIMRKYGDNEWWNSKDQIIRAYHQLFESTMIILFSDFHEGIEKLLGRPVYNSEFLTPEIKKEAEERFKIYEAGGNMETSRGYQEAKLEDAIYRIHEVFERKGKKVIEINFNESNKDDSKLV